MHRAPIPGARTSSTCSTFPTLLAHLRLDACRLMLFLLSLHVISPFPRFDLLHPHLLPLLLQVVIENPWVRVLDKLPDTLARKRYGT